MVPPCEPPALVDAVYSVGLVSHGHTLGGTGIVTMDGGRWSLTLLSPGGLELFTASGPPPAVATGIPAWAPYLKKLPFERDLWLAFTVVPGGRCTVGGGTLRARGAGTTGEGPAGEDETGETPRRTVWRGAGGRARADATAGRVVVRDPRRRYTLTLVAPPVADPAADPEAPDAP